MTDNDVPHAIHSDMLFAKSQVYIRRAILRKENDELDEYQLWASLALELLGKSALSGIHPSLTVDPTHFPSLFAASGVIISTDIKTISAHTLFERMRHVTPRFDERVKNFCVSIAQRRNSELHSGDAPFRSMKLDTWEAQYWHACDLILSQSGSSLDEWLGADTAKAPKAVLQHALSARKDAARERIRSCKLTFEAMKPSEQKLALAQGAAGTELQHSGLFSLLSDLLWDVECPACKGKAYLAGIQTGEEITQEGDGYSEAWESVETTYSPEQFRCPVCSLSLDGYDELEVADLEFDYTTVEEREFEYEPEYGND